MDARREAPHKRYSASTRSRPEPEAMARSGIQHVVFFKFPSIEGRVTDEMDSVVAKGFNSFGVSAQVFPFGVGIDGSESAAFPRPSPGQTRPTATRTASSWPYDAQRLRGIALRRAPEKVDARREALHQRHHCVRYPPRA